MKTKRQTASVLLLFPIVGSLYAAGFQSLESKAGGAADGGARPNVLLICVDDLKPVLGCYGDRNVRSPNVDRLSARSVQFDMAFCNQAVCAPSRNALLTGLRSTTLGIYDLGTNFRKSRPDAVTLPQYFKEHGWKTESLGKIYHIGHGNTGDDASWSVPAWFPGYNAFGGYALPENRPGGPTREEARFASAKVDASKLPRGAPVECADVPDNTYGDGLIAEEAVKRLQAAAAKPGEPFFIAVGFLKPHLPFVAPKKYWDLYKRDQFELAKFQKAPEGAPDYAPSTWGELRQYSDIPAVGPLDPDKQRLLIHGYHAAVSYMDAQLGKVLDEFDKLGLARNTIVIFWGDHGWHLGDHGMWCKHTNYEQAGHIPFLFSAPGMKNGTRTKAMFESVDLYPTLCELAGLPCPAGLDGASFANALRDPENAKTKDHVIHVFPRGVKGRGELIGRALRTERYRLVEWKKPGEAPETADIELYDYQTDPDETKNLAKDKPDVVAQLRAILARQPEAKPQIHPQPDAAKPAAAKPKLDRAAMFESRDKDHDGKLTRDEFLANQPDPNEAPKRFPKFDTNGDGVLSKEEFVNGGRKPAP